MNTSKRTLRVRSHPTQIHNNLLLLLWNLLTHDCQQEKRTLLNNPEIKGAFDDLHPNFLTSIQRSSKVPKRFKHFTNLSLMLLPSNPS
jgi:hypothetical protein